MSFISHYKRNTVQDASELSHKLQYSVIPLSQILQIFLQLFFHSAWK